MNRQCGGGAGLLVALIALTGCTPADVAAAPETVTVTAEVMAVVDGDTIDVTTTDGGTARVRLIGIDTPEIGRGGESSECYAEEARMFLNELLYGQEVELAPDSTQDGVDRYGRLLRYVPVDGVSAAEAAIAAGAGYEYTYDTVYRDQQAHVDAEAAADAAGAGLWGTCHR